MTTLTLQFKNDLTEVRRMAEAVEAFCDEQEVPLGVAMKLSLALDELATNVVSYAFPDGGEHWIRVDVGHADGVLSAVICDDGQPFNPLALPPPDLDAALEDRTIGGLGIHFVRSFVDSVVYVRDGGRNVLSFTKKTDA